MGGKNPVIVTASADLDLAVEGTARSAFGFGGQKCSAASRVYVHESIADEFVRRLCERAEAIPATSPLEPGGFLSPVVNQAALERYDAVAADARHTGEVLTGGVRLTDGHRAAGNYVAPTVVRVPDDSTIWTTELFVPLIAVRSVASLDEALERANSMPFALTAGLFAEDEAEIERFFDRIEAGVVYVNRAAGATTGAWPGVQPFGGMEAVGHGRQGRWRPLLPPAVPARAVAHPRPPRLTALRPETLSDREAVADPVGVHRVDQGPARAAPLHLAEIDQPVTARLHRARAELEHRGCAAEQAACPGRPAAAPSGRWSGDRENRVSWAGALWRRTDASATPHSSSVARSARSGRHPRRVGELHRPLRDGRP
jgi:hypothetical protein